MRGYIHSQTGERLSWYDLKKRLNASIPFLCPSVGEWELEPEPEPATPPEPAEPVVTLEERVSDLEDAVIELAEIITSQEI